MPGPVRPRVSVSSSLPNTSRMGRVEALPWSLCLESRKEFVAGVTKRRFAAKPKTWEHYNCACRGCEIWVRDLNLQRLDSLRLCLRS